MPPKLYHIQKLEGFKVAFVGNLKLIRISDVQGLHVFEIKM